MPGVISKLSVELLGQDGGLYPGTVNDVNEENASLHLKFEEDWLAEGWFPINGSLYEAPPSRTVEETRQRLNIPGSVEVLYRVKLGAPEAWYPGHLVAESKGLYTIDLQLNPSRRVNLPIEHLRVSRHAVPLAADSIRRLQFAVPDNAINEATGEHHLAMFAQYGKLDFVEYDPATKTIVVIACGSAAVHRAQILAEMHLTHAAHRQSFRDEIADMRLELFGPDNSGQAGNYRCEFSVPLQHLSKALGPQQANLSRARALPGIVRIWLDIKSGRFTVAATEEHCAKQAQEILEFVTDVVYIDQPFVGHLIGKQGSNVNEIVRNSNIFSLNIYDRAEHLQSTGLPYEWREGYVTVVLAGLRADTDSAKMLIEYQVDHNRQMDAERRRSGPERPHRRGELSRQHTDEQDFGGEGAGPHLLDGHAQDGLQSRELHGPVLRGEPPVTRDGPNLHRGGQPRRDGQSQFNNHRKDLMRSREDKRNGSIDAVVPSQDWPELGNNVSAGLVRATEGQISQKEIGPVPASNAVVQNGEANGHYDTRDYKQHALARAGGGLNQGGRGRGRGRGGYQQRLDTDPGEGNRQTEIKSALPNGQPNGRVEEVDGEGFKAVQPRGKRGRNQRTDGNGVTHGIRPAPEGPAEIRRDDQVSR